MSKLGYAYGPLLPEFNAILKYQNLVYNYPTAVLKAIHSQMELVNMGLSSQYQHYMDILSSVQYPAQWQDTVQQLNSIQMSLNPSFQELVQSQSVISEIFNNINYQFYDTIAYSTDNDDSLIAKREMASELTSFAKQLNSIQITDEKTNEQMNLDYEMQKLVTEEITEALNNKSNWQQKLMEKALEYRATNPVIAYLIQNIMLALVLSIVSGLIVNTIGQVKSGAKVRALPNSQAQVIYTFNEGQVITITGEAPYYYEVEIDRNGDTTEFSGYISKKSIFPIDDTSGA